MRLRKNMRKLEILLLLGTRSATDVANRLGWEEEEANKLLQELVKEGEVEKHYMPPWSKRAGEARYLCKEK
ncbi:unnamed protein product, partial [marine sediment metagenome]